MAEHLKNIGYSTHIVGKWDLGHYSATLWPVYRGFDSFFGLTCYGYDSYFTHDNEVSNLVNNYKTKCVFKSRSLIKGFFDLHVATSSNKENIPHFGDIYSVPNFLVFIRL